MKFILVADKESPPVIFFPLWEVLSFAIIVTFFLIILYPHHLLIKVMKYDQASPLSVSYLTAFNKKYPNNFDLLMLLTQQQAAIGQIFEAKKNTLKLKKMAYTLDPATKAQFQFIDYQILKYEMAKAKDNIKNYLPLIAQLKSLTKQLATAPLRPNQLKSLALDGLAFDQANLSLQIFQRLFDENQLTNIPDLLLGADIAMQNNEHHASATFYKAAYEKAATIKEKRAFAKDVIKVLWAGDFTHEALQFALSLPDKVIDSPDMLLYVAQIAIAAGRPDIGQAYILRAFDETKRKHE